MAATKMPENGLTDSTMVEQPEEVSPGRGKLFLLLYKHINIPKQLKMVFIWKSNVYTF